MCSINPENRKETFATRENQLQQVLLLLHCQSPPRRCRPTDCRPALAAVHAPAPAAAAVAASVVVISGVVFHSQDASVFTLLSFAFAVRFWVGVAVCCCRCCCPPCSSSSLIETFSASLFGSTKSGNFSEFAAAWITA